jgi:hypothetical protein
MNNPMRSRTLAIFCVFSLIWTIGAHAQQPPVSPLPTAPPPTVVPPVAPPPPPLFTDAERTALVAFWNAPGRQEITALPDAAKTGPWQVRLTPEGSTWLLGYQRAIRGSGKSIPPSQDARASQSSLRRSGKHGSRRASLTTVMRRVPSPHARMRLCCSHRRFRLLPQSPHRLRFPCHRARSYSAGSARGLWKPAALRERRDTAPVHDSYR